MSKKEKPVNRNIADSVAAEGNTKAAQKADRKKVSKSKAKAGRIQAEKRKK